MGTGMNDQTLRALAEVTGRLVRERLQPLVEANNSLTDQVKDLASRIADLEEQVTRP